MSHIFKPWGFKSNGRTVKINGKIGKQGVFRKHICKECGKTHGQGKKYIPRIVKNECDYKFCCLHRKKNEI